MHSYQFTKPSRALHQSLHILLQSESPYADREKKEQLLVYTLWGYLMASSLHVSSADIPIVATEPAGKEKLPAVLTIRDMTVLFVLTVVFISNSNGVQFGGPAAFSYWLLGLFTFLLPTAYVTQWLAKRFPGQGEYTSGRFRYLGHAGGLSPPFVRGFPAQSLLFHPSRAVPYSFSTLSQRGSRIRCNSVWRLS